MHELENLSNTQCTMAFVIVHPAVMEFICCNCKIDGFCGTVCTETMKLQTIASQYQVQIADDNSDRKFKQDMHTSILPCAISNQ